MNVIGLNGALPKTLLPNEKAIGLLTEMLEKARSGEVIGVAVICLHHDGLGSFALAGRVGGYSMLGAVQAANLRLLHIVEELD